MELFRNIKHFYCLNLFIKIFQTQVEKRVHNEQQAQWANDVILTSKLCLARLGPIIYIFLRSEFNVVFSNFLDVFQHHFLASFQRHFYTILGPKKRCILDIEIMSFKRHISLNF